MHIKPFKSGTRVVRMSLKWVNEENGERSKPIAFDLGRANQKILRSSTSQLSGASQPFACSKPELNTASIPCALSLLTV